MDEVRKEEAGSTDPVRGTVKVPRNFDEDRRYSKNQLRESIVTAWSIETGGWVDGSVSRGKVPRPARGKEMGKDDLVTDDRRDTPWWISREKDDVA